MKRHVSRQGSQRVANKRIIDDIDAAVTHPRPPRHK